MSQSKCEAVKCEAVRCEEHNRALLSATARLKSRLQAPSRGSKRGSKRGIARASSATARRHRASGCVHTPLALPGALGIT